jgi:hypothetical protein
MTEDSWPSRPFSIANPRAENPTDLSALLRRVAGEIERQQIKAEDVLVVNIDRGGRPWWCGHQSRPRDPRRSSAARPQAGAESLVR